MTFIKKQSVAFNILNNFKSVNYINTIEQTVELINDNFNKGLIDELTVEQAFEQLDNVIQKSATHKYFKREGVPGNYKYYYTEAEYRAAKGKKPEDRPSEDRPSEVIEKDGKKYKLQSNGKYLETSEHGLTKKEHLEMAEQHYENIGKLLEVDKVDEADKEQGRNVIHKMRASKLSDKEFTKEELKGDKKEGSYIVDNVNNGEVINSLFKEWNSIKTPEQHKEWAKKVANTKFGTYEDKTILSVMSDFNPKFPNEIIRRDFINEVQEAYKNSGGSKEKENAEKNKYLNDYGVHTGMISVLRKSEFARKPTIGEKLSEATKSQIEASITTEAERDYIESLPEFKMDRVPRSNPKSTTENYIAVDDKGDKYLVDTQGSDYMRYVVKLKM